MGFSVQECQRKYRKGIKEEGCWHREQGKGKDETRMIELG